MKRITVLVASFLLLAAWFPQAVYANNPPDPGHSTINGTQAPADGSTVSTVTITLLDSGGAAVPNDNINISSTDSTARFNTQPTIQTQVDGSGKVNISMTATTVGSVNVTVLDTSASPQVTITGSVYFYQPGSVTPTPTATPTPAAGTCTDPAPGSTAVLTSAVSAGAHSITLTWTDASNPVSYYLLSYGLSSGNYIYGNPNIGGQGTTSYTVGGLNTGTKYYFVIRAGNGCTPGNYSNELSAAPGVTTTPTPTPGAATNTTQNLDTTTPSDQITDTPTGIPTPTQAPMVTPTPSGGSIVGTVVAVGTALGVLIVVGVGAWIYINYRRRRRPPPIVY